MEFTLPFDKSNIKDIEEVNNFLIATGRNGMERKKAISAPFTKGVNFTNWLEYRTAEEIDAGFFTKKDFENVKSLGCDVVRLPIHFERICRLEDGYQIPDKILWILDRVVAWAEELQIYVILDFHNNTHIDSVTPSDIKNVLLPIWEQLAKRYRDSTEYIIYELMNEPHGIAIEDWNKTIFEVFRLVREIDERHFIIVGGADWNSFQGMVALPDFQDDKVIYTFHFYDPHTFTHQGAPWCHMERVVGIPFPYDEKRMPPLPEDATEDEKARFERYASEGTLDKVVAFFDQYVEFSRKRNAPVYCGEFGCFAPTVNPRERVKWYELVVGLLKERNIARTSWDYYGSFGLFQVKNPGRGTVCRFPEDLNMDIVKALDLKIPNGLLFDVPDYKKIRVIIDTDAACEADDPFAIVQALLSPKLIVKGIIAEHFNETGSVKKSYDEIRTILDAMDMEVPALMGQEGKMEEDQSISEGVRFLIEEALKESDRPLYVLCQGAITNVAVAFRQCPEIVNRVTVIWIGTHGEAPHEAPFREFNAGNDITAANLVLKSGTDLWLVPSTVYTTITIGLAEIQSRIYPCGKIGKHLFTQMVDYNRSERANWTQGESWSLGDSPAIALAINPGCGHFKYVNAPLIMEDTSSAVCEDNPQIKLYTDVDSRYILEDLIAKLKLFAEARQEEKKEVDYGV